MLSQKKGRADITPDEPLFTGRYVGKTQTYVAIGKGCTRELVQRIWDNSSDEKDMQKVSVKISPRGILLKNLENINESGDIIIGIKHIAYCSAEKDVHDRIFSWISKNSSEKKLECHAVICASKEKAQSMAITLHRAFQIAYKDWKTKRQQADRCNNSQNGAADENDPVAAASRKKAGNGSNHSANKRQSLEGDSDDSAPFMASDVAQMNCVEEEEIPWQGIILDTPS